VYARLPDIRRRFDVEAKAAASLRSRHVVQVFDNGELADGTPFMVMEFLEGEALSRRLQRSGPQPVAECVRVMSQVARALHKAHEAGIVHRDIKPENIYLAQTNDEDAFVAKVLDFGIAKVSAPGDQSTTSTGALLGTPMFMSPEQARGMKAIDYRTDLFSLGLVAYSMLTGMPPFSGESYGDLILQICTQPLPSVRARAPWVPEAVDAWFRQACAREPEARFLSARQMGESFAAACGHPSAGVGMTVPGGTSAPALPGAGYPTNASTDVPVSSTQPPPPRSSPVALLSIALGGLAMGSLGIVLAVHLTRGAPAPATAAAPQVTEVVTPVEPPTPAVSLSPPVSPPDPEASASASTSSPAPPPPTWQQAPWKAPSGAATSGIVPRRASKPNMGF
jgi:serine/threonine protein kinase